MRDEKLYSADVQLTTNPDSRIPPYFSPFGVLIAAKRLFSLFKDTIKCLVRYVIEMHLFYRIRFSGEIIYYVALLKNSD